MPDEMKQVLNRVSRYLDQYPDTLRDTMIDGHNQKVTDLAYAVWTALKRGRFGPAKTFCEIIFCIGYETGCCRMEIEDA